MYPAKADLVFPASRFVLVSVFVAVLSGCGGALESVEVTAPSPDGPVTVPIRDVPRAAPEDELTLSTATNEPYSLVVTEDLPVSGLDVIRLEMTGTPGGGALRVARGDRSDTVSYDSLFQLPGETRSVTVTIPLPEWFLRDGAIPEDTELSFLPPRDGSYRIEAIDFRNRSTGPAEVESFWGPEAVSIDDRLRVFDTPGSLRVEGFDELLRTEGDAVVIEYTHDSSAFVDRDSRPEAMIESGSSRFRLRTRPGAGRVVFRPALWGGTADTITLGYDDPGFRPTRVAVVPYSEDPDEILPVELTELRTYPRRLWRRDDFEVLSWSLYPNILWIDSISYEVQAAFFKRLAFFVEKRGFIGTLLTDEELAGRHGYNAHNYRPEGLAAFFNAVEDASFPINRYEVELRDIVADHGIIRRGADGRWETGTGGVLGISQESYPELRRLLIVHEAMHGVFYEEPAFVDGVVAYWRNTLTDRERRFWQDALAWMRYSPDDEYLVYNEFQAYLLQQSESGVRWYFRTRLADRVRNYANRFEPVDTFLADHPTTFVDAGRAFNRLLFETAGMVGGDPFCLEPIDDGAEG
ncbi:MAG: hypothetical protein ACLFSV_04215 [Alkalispirochaeta sp.]